MKKKYHTVIILILLVLVLGRILILPRNISDIIFEKRIESAISSENTLILSDVTNFKWDSVYYFNGPYLDNEGVSDAVGFEVKHIRDAETEIYHHLIFVEDHRVVKQFIFMYPLEINLDEKYGIDYFKSHRYIKLNQLESVFSVEFLSDREVYILSPK